MVVAMVTVRMVQVAVDQVVDVVTVRDGFVATTGTMDVVGLMAAALVLGGAAVGIGHPITHKFQHASIAALHMKR